ncbi:MAG: circadian clock KaiB family protein [Desulfurivibrio sp.]|nr:circadian clock KaiB family protein [Desulfurivibrio sp.]
MTPENNNTSGTDMDHTEQGGEHPHHPVYHLRLFVTSSTGRSQQAIHNIREICEKYLQGQYELEVIDIYEQPDKVREMQILAVPTLLRKLPEPLRRIVGDLSEKDKVLEGLDIQLRE